MKKGLTVQLLSQARRLFGEPQSRDTTRVRFARGVAWSFIGNALGQVAKLGGSVIIGRLLGQTIFGELGVITSTVGLFGIFAGMGFGTTATKYVADLRDREPGRAGQTIGFLLTVGLATGTAISLCVSLAAPAISGRILNASHLVEELRIGSLLLVLNVLNGIQLGALMGLESFRSTALLGMFDGVVGLVLAGVGAWLFGLAGAVAGHVLCAALLCLGSHVALAHSCRQHHIAVRYGGGGAEWGVLWRFGLPAFLVLASTQPFTWATRVILANRPDGYSQLGLLNAAFTWGSVLLFLPRQVSRPSLPILSNLHGARRSGQFSRVFGVSLLLTQGTAVVVAAPVMLLAPYIMRSYGESFVAGTPTMVVMALAHTISAGTLTFRDAIASSGRMWAQVGHSIVWGLTLIATAVAWSGLGARGVAYAFLVAYVVLFAVQVFYLGITHLLDIRILLHNRPAR